VFICREGKQYTVDSVMNENIMIEWLEMKIIIKEAAKGVLEK
jgi:hypothetical protein